MKILKVILSIFLFTSISNSTIAQEVDLEKSTVKWLGKKVTGQHNGTINLKKADLTIENDQITSGEFTIDMNSIVCLDLEDEGYNKKLVGHLKSDDFFGVEKNPESTLKITSATAFNGHESSVKADLSIKGKTLPIEFKVHKMKGNKFHAALKVDRSKYDIRYGSNSFFDNLGDKAIDDIFELDIILQTK